MSELLAKVDRTKLSIENKYDFSDNEKYRVRHTTQIKKPDVVLQFGDKIVATRKNLFGVTGKAKVGKTFLMTLLNTSVLLKGTFGNILKSFLPKGKDKILYFDTEQSDYHVYLVMNRIYDLVKENKIENLLMYSLDAVPTAERYAFVKHKIESTPEVGMAIIDGIADLIYDPNDIRESVDIVDNLRIWATTYDLAIGYVLHQNPSDNAKMRGHLGTLLTNKSETVIQITSAKDNDSVKLVETTQTRNAKPDNWSFEIIDGMPVIQDDCYELPTMGRPKMKQLNDIEKMTMLNDIFSKDLKDLGFSSTVLLEKMKEKFVATYKQTPGRDYFIDLLRYCRDMNWITKDSQKSNFKQQPYVL
jgi:hypothetical protein